jgi:uncharacterized protein (TIGR02391 family)
MADRFGLFQKIVRKAYRFAEKDNLLVHRQHPFIRHNIHPDFPPKVRKLFDDGHYAEATFEAFKFIDKIIQRHSKNKESGFKLMMNAFNENNPLIRLTRLSNISEIDEQEGFKFLFAGGSKAIRNPRGHECNIKDNENTCLDHLAFASLLIRRLEQAGFS